jgi:hypothetical protein
MNSVKIKSICTIYKALFSCIFPMFFVKQIFSFCGLISIQNMFKSCKITYTCMHAACEKIFEETGDPVSNHESFGGNWSVAAVLKAITMAGYEVIQAVETKEQRIWAAASIQDLMEDPEFRGVIIHQQHRHHFTCLRTEKIDGENKLYLVDSQSPGPICISPKLAMQRCIAPAYSWEAYIIMGPEMESILPTVPAVMKMQVVLPSGPTVMKQYTRTNTKRQRKKPPPGFLEAYNKLKRDKQ